MTEKRYFEWNGHRREIGSPHLTDYEIACQVRMLMRDQLNHELVCMDGRDRIICLIAEKDALKHDIERHLKITSEQAIENERLGSERDAALARVSKLEALLKRVDYMMDHYFLESEIELNSFLSDLNVDIHYEINSAKDQSNG